MLFWKKTKNNILFSSLFFSDRQYVPEDSAGVFSDVSEDISLPAALARPPFRQVLPPEQHSVYSIFTDYDLSYYAQLLQIPVKPKHMFWPVDMIEAGFLSPSARWDLLFPCERDDGPFTSLTVFLKTVRPHWQPNDYFSLASKICRAVEEINNLGYLYGDLSPDHIFVTRDEQICLDFTDLLFPIQNDAEDNLLCGYTAAPDRWPPFVTRSSLMNGTQPSLDTAAQNYALAALLFYILFRRYPCDGRLLDGYSGESAQSRKLKARAYHVSPYFLFELHEAKNPNRLGDFQEERALIEQWNTLPAILQEYFRAVLSYENAVSSEPPRQDVTPSDWLEAFRQQCL